MKEISLLTQKILDPLLQYETSQKKRDEKCRQRLKEKEHKFGGPLRRETWIHPSGGRRIHRTTPLDLGTGKSGDTSDEEELDAMSTADVGQMIWKTTARRIMR